jgi:hypothetical protein
MAILFNLTSAPRRQTAGGYCFALPPQELVLEPEQYLGEDYLRHFGDQQDYQLVNRSLVLHYHHQCLVE